MPVNETGNERIDTAETKHRIESVLKETTPTPENLVKIANILGVEVAEVIPRCSCSTARRPYFGPDQVRNVHQIKKGLKYHKMYKSKERPFIVVQEPFYDTERNGWWVKIRYQNGGGSGNDYEDTLSLRDQNIFPYGDYGDEKWSKGWLAFTDESRYLAHSCCHHHCCGHHCCSHHCHHDC